MAGRQIITLTTDFGYNDPFVGVLKGVMLKINPDVEFIDITHGILPQDIREAAYTIGMNYRFFPDDTIHIVIVDPGVGSARRPILVHADHHYFIGPDNGIFSYIYGMEHDVMEVFHITADHYFLNSHSPTFQARDIFAAIAGWMSRGIGTSKLGEVITDYQNVRLPAPEFVSNRLLKGEVIHMDRFGNAMTNISLSDINKLKSADPPDGEIRVFLKKEQVPLKNFYSEAEDDQLYCLINSSGLLEFFVYRGNAASAFNIGLANGVDVILAK